MIFLFEFCGNDFVSKYLKIFPVAIFDLQKVNNFVIREKKRPGGRYSAGGAKLRLTVNN